MEHGLNPYVPGSGRTPPALVGRGTEIALFDRLVARSKMRQIDRGIVLSGLRGVGKTVLLNELRRIADAKGWVSVSLEGQTAAAGAAAVRSQLGRDLYSAARNYSKSTRREAFFENVREVITSFSITLGTAGVSLAHAPSMNRAESGNLETDLLEMVEDISNELRADRSALAIFIDEMQDLDKDLLAALLTTQHLASQRDWPFYLIGAGLPNLPGELTKARSYAERLMMYRSIGPLPAEEARTALVKPASDLGVKYENEAASLLVSSSRGYPYFIQEFGNAAWELATGRIITLQDAKEALDTGWAHLDVGFFPARWERATPKERQYLAAMAQDGDKWSSTTAVSERLNTTLAGVSSLRQRLIDKGIIYAPEKGKVAFTVPGMSSFIDRDGCSSGPSVSGPVFRMP
jgi:hypothetical protein